MEDLAPKDPCEVQDLAQKGEGPQRFGVWNEEEKPPC